MPDPQEHTDQTATDQTAELAVRIARPDEPAGTSSPQVTAWPLEPLGAAEAAWLQAVRRARRRRRGAVGALVLLVAVAAAAALRHRSGRRWEDP